MDEALKALLLLNGVSADGRAWETLKSNGTEPRALWEDNVEGLKGRGLTDNAISRLRDNQAAGWAEREYERCLHLKVRIVSYGDACYPKPLYDLKDPPLILYWHGRAPSLPGRTVSVVGTRRSTAYGRRIAHSIGEDCSRRHIGLVSGGALGIDGSAHMGTCSTGGSTFAVFGNGINVTFPLQNKALFEEIRENGALISEFPLDTAGEAWRFPRRNRIVAALAERLIVVEAPVKSGAMITARIALELGREVWAVPGRIDEDVSSGSNRLIFDGAYPFIDREVFFGAQAGQSSFFDAGPSTVTVPKAEDFPPDEAAVLTALWYKGGKTVDNLAQEVKMSAADILKTIAVLSAKGMVYSSGPGRFSAKV